MGTVGLRYRPRCPDFADLDCGLPRTGVGGGGAFCTVSGVVGVDGRFFEKSGMSRFPLRFMMISSGACHWCVGHDGMRRVTYATHSPTKIGVAFTV
jgi:hypothetical protein